jgi:micrococcal nuclease
MEFMVKGLLALAGAHKVATGLVAVAVVAGGSVVHAAMAGTSTTATVERVVDGDTIDVEYEGDTHRVRLLNVNTPESVDPDKPVECLGPEASDWLEQRLPVGTEVRLERDQETRDRYDRELAAVFLGNDLINAEIARAGYGVAMSVGSNIHYLSQVKAAQAEAQSAGRGLYSTTVHCTIPAQAEQLQAAATEALGEAPSEAAALSEFDSHGADLAAVLATAKTLKHVLEGDVDAFPLVAYVGRVSAFEYQVESAQRELSSAKTANGNARAARKQQLDAEARAAEEAARLAAEEAQRQAEAAAAAAAAEAARRSSPSPSGTSSRSSGSSTASRTASPTKAPTNSGSGNPTGYTGCRSYAPGGKTWTPIPC